MGIGGDSLNLSKMVFLAFVAVMASGCGPDSIIDKIKEKHAETKRLIETIEYQDRQIKKLEKDLSTSKELYKKMRE